MVCAACVYVCCVCVCVISSLNSRAVFSPSVSLSEEITEVFSIKSLVGVQLCWESDYSASNPRKMLNFTFNSLNILEK